MTDSSPSAGRPRQTRKADVRAAILIALLDLLGEGIDINHDRVAERAGVARRTVYRYFPDQQALMRPVWDMVTRLAGPGVAFPDSEATLLASLPDIHRGFDAIAPLATVMRATPQGRQVRLAQKMRRQDSYRAAMADATKGLSAEDRLLATAMLQLLHTTPWLEMRDQWDLEADRIATACGWAMRVLLKDLRERGAKPLRDGPA